MTPSERLERIVSDYGSIEDPRERFQMIVETPPGEPFPEAARIDANLVPGCVSRVWLAVWREEGGGIAVRVDSESPALRGIGALFARLYSGSRPEEIAATEPGFLVRLGIDRHLTPTRLRGLDNLRRRLVEAAEVLSGTSHTLPPRDAARSRPGEARPEFHAGPDEGIPSTGNPGWNEAGAVPGKSQRAGHENCGPGKDSPE